MHADILRTERFVLISIFNLDDPLNLTRIMVNCRDVVSFYNSKSYFEFKTVQIYFMWLFQIQWPIDLNTAVNIKLSNDSFSTI